MQHETELREWVPTPPGILEKLADKKIMPYESSRIGEYSKRLLLFLALPLAIWFANNSLIYKTGNLLLIASLIVLGTLATPRGFHVFRVALLGKVTAYVLTFAINPQEISIGENSKYPEWTVFLLLFCLIVAFVFETAAWIKSNTRAVLFRTFAWAIFFTPAFIQQFVTPGNDSFWMTN